MESIATEKFYDINEKIDNIVILEISNKDNTYKQISIKELLEKLGFNEIRLQGKTNIKNYDSLKINVDSTEVYKSGIKINLSPGEYKLLRLFIDNKGKILSNEQIINCVWGIAYANTGMLRVAIKRLRSKIDPRTEHLKTIRGKGYMLSDF